MSAPFYSVKKGGVLQSMLQKGGFTEQMRPFTEYIFCGAKNELPLQMIENHI